MKKLFFTLILVCLSGCASAEKTSFEPVDPKKETWASDYIGKSGYFTRPVALRGSKKFDRCKKAKITGLSKLDNYGNLYTIVVDVEQGGKKFTIKSVGNRPKIRKLKKPDPKNGHYIIELKHYFSSSLPIKSRSLQFKDGEKDAKKLVCNGGIFTGMTKKELTFVKGDPSDKNKHTSRLSRSEQWVYGSVGYSKYYYFSDGVLDSWSD